MEESRLLRLPAVLTLTGLKKSSIYEKSKNGTFPKPVRLGARAVAWRADELSQWIDELPRATS
jgi:prophage regulatory protein